MAKATKPALTLLQISGIFPYSYLKTGELDEFAFSRSGIICLVITGILLLSGSIFDIMICAKAFDSTNWLAFIDKLEIGIIGIMGVFAFVLVVLRRNSIRNVCNTILNISAELLEPTLVRKVVKILIIVQLLVSFLICGSLHILPVIITRIFSKSAQPTLAMDVLYLIRYLFSLVFWSVEFLLIDVLVAIRACIYAADTYLASAAMEEVSENNNNSMALRKIVLRRQNLLDLTGQVNDMFSPVLALSAAWSLLELLYSAYYGISFAIQGDDSKLETSVFYTYLLGWFIYHAVSFSILCWACGAIADESRNAACRIHRVLQVLPVTAEKIRNRLYEYSLAMRNCPLHITAMGFFNMDLGLCMNMISGLATYLIILLQFKFTPTATDINI